MVKWDKGRENNYSYLILPLWTWILKALIEKRGYLLKSKKEKSKLLDEYCQNRNYVIRKIGLEPI